MTLSAEQLDHMRCMNPTCRQPHPHRLFLSAKCHRAGPLFVAYEHGVLRLTCGCCNALVCEIAVAPSSRAHDAGKGGARGVDAATSRPSRSRLKH